MKILFTTTILVVFASSCSLIPKKAEPKLTSEPAEVAKPTPPAPKLIGIVASIPPGRKFILIQRYDRLNIETGEILTSKGLDQRSANLKFTGESLGEFAAADIQAGDVSVGDAVYEAPPKTVDTAENQTLTPIPKPTPLPTP